MTPRLALAMLAPWDWQTSAKTNGFETLMIVNDTSASPTA